MFCKAWTLNKWWWLSCGCRRLEGEDYTGKTWALQRGPRPHCVLRITKYRSVNLFTAPLALTVCLPPVIHYNCHWIERWKKKAASSSCQKSSSSKEPPFIKDTFFRKKKNLEILMGLFLQSCHCKNTDVPASLPVPKCWCFISVGEDTFWEHWAPLGQTRWRWEDWPQSHWPHQARGSRR